MKYNLLFASLLLLGSSWSQSDTIRIVSYNLLNFPNGRNDCSGSNVNVPDRYDSLRKVMQFTRPDIFVACEVQEKRGADSVLTRSLNVFGQNNYAMATWVANTSGANDLQNILFYNTDKLALAWQDEIVTGVRDINHYVLYALDPNLGNHYDTTFYEVFMCHLKAGNTTQNEQDRLQEVQQLRAYLDTRPVDRHYFVCGDMNVYKSSEPAYQAFISGGVHPLVDPINSPGNWNNNSSFAGIHTQSSRASGSFDCGSTGGLDDRFDHILVSPNVLSGADSVHYVTNSYAAIGNDGNHFNGSINSGFNSQYPDSITNALFYISDHLPVYLETVINYPLTNGLALVPQVQSVSCHGAADGSIAIVPNAGQAPYTYQWDAAAGSQTTQTATGLVSGSYCVTVTDALGEVDDYCVFLGQPAAIAYTLFTNPETENCNGEASVLVSGGASPYTFQWDDPLAQTGNPATGLCAGNYTCTLTDGNGCQEVINAVILYLEALELDALQHLKVYPNPAQELLFVANDSQQQIRNAKIELLSLTGQVVLEQSAQEFSAGQQVALELSTVETGMYVVRVNGVTVSRVQVL